MEILYCERCGVRLKAEDLHSGRCRREEERLWCPGCSAEIASAPAGSVRAQVIAEPSAVRRPPGAVPVSGQKTPPPGNCRQVARDVKSPQLGPYALPSRCALAPLAEFTAWPLRLLCQESGAAFACTEMVKARFVVTCDAATLKVLERHPDEQLCGAQLCGADPGELAEAAARLVHELGFPFVDLNAACPRRRIIFDGGGAGLLTEPARLERIVRAMADAASPAPVTVKLRSGVRPDQMLAVEAARAAEAGGAALIAIHPRFASQGYTGRPDHAVSAAVKTAVRVPVMAGGDLHHPREAEDLLRRTGCDLAFLGRVAIGAPWVFALSAEDPLFPGWPRFLSVFRRHVAMLEGYLGEGEACLRVRRLAKEYARAIPDAGEQAAFYDALKGITSLEQCRAYCDTLRTS
jgi:nifR3 family TIM-barrel protein